MTTLPLRSEVDAQHAADSVRGHLARGGILGYPTETVYGLGALLAPASLALLHTLKPRTPGQPVLILVDGIDMAEALGLDVSPAARDAARQFWPGPLTLVLPDREGRLPSDVRNAEGGVAVRETSHIGARALVSMLRSPITSTSANAHGAAPARSAEEVVEAFPDAVQRGDLWVLDGGRLPPSPPSTMLDCCAAEPTMLREGAIPLARLAAAIKELRV